MDLFAFNTAALNGQPTNAAGKASQLAGGVAASPLFAMLLAGSDHNPASAMAGFGVPQPAAAASFAENGGTGNADDENPGTDGAEPLLATAFRLFAPPDANPLSKSLSKSLSNLGVEPEIKGAATPQQPVPNLPIPPQVPQTQMPSAGDPQAAVPVPVPVPAPPVALQAQIVPPAAADADVPDGAPAVQITPPGATAPHDRPPETIARVIADSARPLAPIPGPNGLPNTAAAPPAQEALPSAPGQTPPPDPARGPDGKPPRAEGPALAPGRAAQAETTGTSSRQAPPSLAAALGLRPQIGVEPRARPQPTARNSSVFEVGGSPGPGLQPSAANKVGVTPAIAPTIDQPAHTPPPLAGPRPLPAAGPLPAAVSEAVPSEIAPAAGAEAGRGSPAPSTAGALAEARPGAMPTPLAEQVAVHIHKAIQDGNRQITIQLQPETLGRIEVRLHLGEAGSLQAAIVVDRPETLELFQRDARGLERALQQAGLSTQGGDLNFSLRDDGQETRGDRLSRPNDNGDERFDLDGLETERDGTVETVTLTPTSGVDIHV